MNGVAFSIYIHRQTKFNGNQLCVSFSFILSAPVQIDDYIMLDLVGVKKRRNILKTARASEKLKMKHNPPIDGNKLTCVCVCVCSAWQGLISFVLCDKKRIMCVSIRANNDDDTAAFAPANFEYVYFCQKCVMCLCVCAWTPFCVCVCVFSSSLRRWVIALCMHQPH